MTDRREERQVSTFQAVQGRCPGCSRSSLMLGAGGYVTCASLDCPDPAAAGEVLERQTVGVWPGERCEITIDVITKERKGQVRRVTPLHADDMAATRALLALELRTVADEIDQLFAGDGAK